VDGAGFGQRFGNGRLGDTRIKLGRSAAGKNDKGDPGKEELSHSLGPLGRVFRNSGWKPIGFYTPLILPQRKRAPKQNRSLAREVASRLASFY
jgi:hypothetical protein